MEREGITGQEENEHDNQSQVKTPFTGGQKNDGTVSTLDILILLFY